METRKLPENQIIHRGDAENAEFFGGERRMTPEGGMGSVLGVNKITELVIGAAIEVHRHLGPGLLESAYEECLCRELALRNTPFDRQVALPISYKGLQLDCSYRVDLLVEKLLVVELKSVELLLPIHEAQVLTYMRLGGWKVGLLLNFNVPILKRGIKRLVLGFKE